MQHLSDAEIAELRTIAAYDPSAAGGSLFEKMASHYRRMTEALPRALDEIYLLRKERNEAGATLYWQRRALKAETRLLLARGKLQDVFEEIAPEGEGE